MTQIRFAAGSLAELTQDPLLSMAAMVLIAVSIAWIVVSRLITREIRRNALRQMKTRPGRKPPHPPKDKDIWSYPP